MIQASILLETDSSIIHLQFPQWLRYLAWVALFPLLWYNFLLPNHVQKVIHDTCCGTRINFQNPRRDVISTWCHSMLELLDCILNLVLRYSTTVNTEFFIVINKFWTYLRSWSIHHLLKMLLPPVHLVIFFWQKFSVTITHWYWVASILLLSGHYFSKLRLRNSLVLYAVAASSACCARSSIPSSYPFLLSVFFSPPFYPVVLSSFLHNVSLFSFYFTFLHVTLISPNPSFPIMSSLPATLASDITPLKVTCFSSKPFQWLLANAHRIFLRLIALPNLWVHNCRTVWC